MPKRQLEISESEPEEERYVFKNLANLSQEIVNQMSSGITPQNTEEHEIRVWVEDGNIGNHSIVIPVNNIENRDDSDDICCSDCPEYPTDAASVAEESPESDGPIAGYYIFLPDHQRGNVAKRTKSATGVSCYNQVNAGE